MSTFIDLTGQRFARLIVLSRVEKNKHGQAMWLCQCDCGNQTVVQSGHLRSGHTKSCGCTHETVDLTGQRFGKLTVLQRDKNKQRQTTWLCQCDCGKQTVVLSGNLKSGNTQSCGCSRRKPYQRNAAPNTI